MVDIFSKKKRSEIMSKIRSKGTKPEKLLASALRRHKIRFRMHANLPGKPDFIIPDKKVAVFCDGTFWHGYLFNKWKVKLAPFWLKKISGNIKRDRKANRELKKLGWKVVRCWDFEIIKSPADCINRILRACKNGD
jgi:DNA mismatch endonuclease (patch repair protein)